MESVSPGYLFLPRLEQHITEVFLLAAPDWSVLHYASPSYERVWGRPRRALFSNPLAWTEAVVPEDRAALAEVTRRREGAEAGAGGQAEFRIVRTDGALRHMVARLASVEALEGGGPALLMQAEDQTERKQAEARLRELEAKLEEAKAAFKVLLENRGEEMDQLVGNLEATRRKLIQPCLDRLKISRLDEHQLGLLARLESSLDELSTPFDARLSLVLSKLTPREAEIAQLVRQGRGNLELSEMLNISDNAVAFHRQNIRRKLGLKGKKINLYSYLNSLAG